MARLKPAAKGKGRALAGVRPNAGLANAYAEKLQDLVDELHASVLYWITVAYRANRPEMAQDASPARELQSVMDRLATRWKGNIAKQREPLGRWFAQASQDRSDKQLQSILKRAGFAVKFTLTRSANDVLQATTGENVALISDLGERYLSEISSMVQRSVAAGGDLKTLTDNLTERYGITRRRATFIAQDQAAKASANMTRARYLEVGIKTAVWRHSRGGKHPRASHVAFDGKEFDVREGAYIDGEFIQPGSLPRCRCFAKPVLPTLTDDDE